MGSVVELGCICSYSTNVVLIVHTVESGSQRNDAINSMAAPVSVQSQTCTPYFTLLYVSAGQCAYVVCVH